MNHHADRRFNRQRNAIHQRVRHANRLNREPADGELLLRRDFDQLDLIEHMVLVELAFHVCQRELGGVDGDFDFAQNPRQAANVVLVPVRQDNAAHALLVFYEVGDVRHDNIDAEQLRFGEHEARVDDDNVVFPFERHAVHAELAEPARV